MIQAVAGEMAVYMLMEEDEDSTIRLSTMEDRHQDEGKDSYSEKEGKCRGFTEMGMIS